MHFIVSHTHLLFVKHCHFKEGGDLERFASIVSRPPTFRLSSLSSRKKFSFPKGEEENHHQFLYRLKLPTSAAAPAGSSSSLLEPFPINLFHCSPIHSIILSTTIMAKNKAP